MLIMAKQDGASFTQFLKIQCWKKNEKTRNYDTVVLPDYAIKENKDTLQNYESLLLKYWERYSDNILL